jgi:hypothetical protein
VVGVAQDLGVAVVVGAAVGEFDDVVGVEGLSGGVVVAAGGAGVLVAAEDVEAPGVVCDAGGH